MSTKNNQATALHRFLQNENIVRHLQELTTAYHPMIVRPAGDPNAPWELTEDEAQTILRIYPPSSAAAPSLSSARRSSMSDAISASLD